ncbi:hypothetical protein [Actinomyces wuliandei]|uniref:hypothetical protein n=1 Tax=Actinomyces wuliandei TaxID=2057743 RepID=UPI0019D4C252|nr:hypothetical protein [Actinomyces wuliandei]
MVVIAVVAAALALANTMSSRDGREDTAAASSSPPSAPSTPASAQSPGGGSSVCGLDGEVLEGTVSIAPEAQWQYQGTTAYPTSTEYGPGATADAGYRYCFQHSPEGALFAAANAVVQGSDATISPAWIKYFLSTETPNRSALLDQVPAGSSSSNRMTVADFRLLAYDGTNARVDVAVQATGSGNTVLASTVYDLVWEEGDWKILPQDFSNPLRLAEIPDTSGYIVWGE